MENQKMKNNVTSKIIFRITSILWGLWGFVHLFGGLFMLSFLGGGVKNLPESVLMKMMGNEMPLPIVPTLMEHNFNNTWFGLVILIGSFFVWKENRNAVLFCCIVGGLAQIGYAIFIVFPGHSTLPGVVINFVFLVAIVFGIIAIKKS